MVAESFAIIAICLLLAVSCMRSKFSKVVVSILPIAILPALHLLIKGVVYLTPVFNFRSQVVIAFVDAIALGITCAVVVLLGSRITTKKSRHVYCIVVIGYSVLMGWAYIFNTLQPLLR